MNKAKYAWVTGVPGVLMTFITFWAGIWLIVNQYLPEAVPARYALDFGHGADGLRHLRHDQALAGAPLDPHDHEGRVGNEVKVCVEE